MLRGFVSKDEELIKEVNVFLTKEARKQGFQCAVWSEIKESKPKGKFWVQDAEKLGLNGEVKDQFGLDVQNIPNKWHHIPDE